MNASVSNNALERACIDLDAEAVALALKDGADPCAVDHEKTPMIVVAVDTNYCHHDAYQRMKDVVALLLDAGASPNQACPPGANGMETVPLQLIVSRIMHDYMDEQRANHALSVMELLLENGASPTPEILLHHGIDDMMGGIISAIRDHPDLNDPDCAFEDFNPDLFKDSCERMALMLARHGAPRISERIRHLRLPEEREQRAMSLISEASMAKNTPAGGGRRAGPRL